MLSTDVVGEEEVVGAVGAEVLETAEMVASRSFSD